MAAVLKRGLEEDGHRVDVVTSGPDALRQAMQATYDVVLLDVMLPGMSGVEVCRRLRLLRTRSSIIMVSACDSLTVRDSAMTAGADNYLVKPVPFSTLIESVETAARGCAGDI